jgi:thiol-disulfide isomerase/thioredoxin
MKSKLAFLTLLALSSFGCNRTRAEGETSPQAEVTVAAAPNPVDTATQVELPAELVGTTGERLIEVMRSADGRRGTLVNVWASFCGSCRAEMPMMLKVKERYREQGIELVFVSVDQLDKTKEAVAFLDELHVPTPSYIVLGRLGLFKKAMSPMWPGSLPATFLFDATGKLRYFWGARVFEEELTPILDGFLAGEDIDGVANVMIRRSPAAQ